MQTNKILYSVLSLLTLWSFGIHRAQAHGHVAGTVDTLPARFPFLFQHHAPGTTALGSLMMIALLVAVITAAWLYYKNRSRFSLIQKVGWVYAAMFFATTSLTYIPGLADDQGNFVGLFKLDLIDDLLHFASALWITWAAWHSTKQATLYFRIFGALYAFDAVLGLITQRGILDLGIWLYERPNISLAANIGANLPHLLIGSIALYTGFVLSKKVKR